VNKVKIGDYKISDLYAGSYNSLDSGYGNASLNYGTSIGDIGIPTDPRVATIAKEFSDKIAPGQKNVEVSMVMPEVAESIPTEELKEVNRMSKLTGVDVTVHGPLVEASGLSREGFSEANREAAERQMSLAVERAHQVSPDGSSPITFHSSTMLPAPEVRRIPEKERKKEGIKEKEEIERLFVIDQESGQINAVKKDIRYHPAMREIEKGEIREIPLEKGEKISAEKQVRIMNDSQWDDSLTKLITPMERTNVMIEQTYPLIKPIAEKLDSGEKKVEDLSPTQREILARFSDAHDQLGDVRKHLNSIFEKAYKYGSEKEKRDLKELAKDFEKKVYIKDPVTGIEGPNPDLRQYSNALSKLRRDLTPFKPELFKSLNDFAIDKSVKTFGNVAFESYKKFGGKAPIISIENPPASMGAFSRGEDLKKLVERAREQFVKRATQSKSEDGLGISESEAKKQAEKLIGVTWDVGHINQLRKYGFTEKDIIKEAEKVAPYLKHVHLSDNFGIENVELPMGMGNVPFKEIMKKLGKKGEKAKKIVEAGHWWQHFKVSPVGRTFEFVSPYWSQIAGAQGGYFSGYGPTLPQINYETFGTGFSQLPAELGGQRAGARGSRLGGTPLE